jgi:undecaprenyl diphosphate synthase
MSRVPRILSGYNSLLIPAREITIKDIDAQLMTSLAGCPPLDIFLRTGGDKRLSELLLWQVRTLNSPIPAVDVCLIPSFCSAAKTRKYSS